ncbi:MAG: hypothetical protein KAS86_04360, partial [Candidatus Omnitrophica bacterium]|nr:hypothetical protein [Candidatus Omnitrophota bacterium]
MNTERTKNKGFAMMVMAVMVVLILAWVVIIAPVPEAHADCWCTRQMTDNTASDSYPSLYNGGIAWQGVDGSDFDIYYWDGATTT